MYEPWIFATTLAAGGSLFAYSVALQPQRNDARPITPEPPAAVHVIPPAPPTPVAEPRDNRVLELEPVVIKARMHHPAAAPPVVAAPEPEQRPCSNWRSLGPTHVAAGNTTGEVTVRSLCP